MEGTMQRDRLALRIPEEIKEDWRQRAERDQRSLTNWVIWMIERFKDEAGRN